MVTIAVVVPTIPPRKAERDRLTDQINAQTRQPDEVIFWHDSEGYGAAITRNIAIGHASSEFVALFDDDDIMYPRHLELLERTQAKTNADLVYPWHDLVPSRPNPLGVDGQSAEGRPFDAIARRWLLRVGNFIPCAVLVRRKAIMDIGGFRDFQLEAWDPNFCELADAWRRLLRNSATFAHCPHRTWAAVRGEHNTAGLNWREHIGTKQEGYD